MVVSSGTCWHVPLKSAVMPRDTDIVTYTESKAETLDPSHIIFWRHQYKPLINISLNVRARGNSIGPCM